MGIFSKGINKGAYQGKLTCPYTYYITDGKSGDIKTCGGTAWRFVEEITPYRTRYRCRKCGGTVQYDISGQPGYNPYAAYQKGRIWDNIKRVAGGRKLKGRGIQ